MRRLWTTSCAPATVRPIRGRALRRGPRRQPRPRPGHRLHGLRRFVCVTHIGPGQAFGLVGQSLCAAGVAQLCRLRRLEPAFARGAAPVTDRAAASASSATSTAPTPVTPGPVAVRPSVPSSASASLRAASARARRSGSGSDRARALARGGCPRRPHTAGRRVGIRRLGWVRVSRRKASRTMESRSGGSRPRSASWAAVISARAAPSPPVTSSSVRWRPGSRAQAVMWADSPWAWSMRKYPKSR